MEDNIVEFIYKYNNHENKECEVSINIELPFERGDECLDELVTRLLNDMETMQRYLDEHKSKKI